MRKYILTSLFMGLTLVFTKVSAQTAAQPALGSGLGQLMLGLGGVLVLLIGSLWLLKRLTSVRGTASGMMRVVAATAVGSRERVVIVEVGSSWLVLGVAPGRVSALAEIPRQALAEPTQAVAQSTAADWLQRFMPRR